MFEAIKFIHVTFSSFENLHVFHVFMRENSVVIFAKLCHNKGIGAHKLK